MNRAITITLSGQVFQIEESAYEKLSVYLDGVRGNLSGGQDTDEVMSDIETSIAEKFGAKTASGRLVITQTDVLELISVMGEPEIFDQEQATDAHDSSPEPSAAKKLYRNPDDVIIAGVCSGLATYFGIDAVIIRLLFAVTTFFGGAGVVLYILFWIIVPEAKTNSQKMAMQGKPVTLASIEEAVKKNVSKINNEKNRESIKSLGRRLVEFPFDLLRLLGRTAKKALKALVPVVRIAAGLFIFLMAALGFGCLTFLFMAALLDINGTYLVSGLPLATLLLEPPFRLGLVAVYLFLIMPVLFAGQGAVSLLRKKNSYTLASIGIMFGVFMVAGITAGLVGLQYGPRLRDYANRSESVMTRNIPVSGYRGISVTDNISVSIEPGDGYGLEARGSQTALDRIEASVSNGVLELSQAERQEPFCLFCNRWHQASLTITAPELESYRGAGYSSAKITGFTGPKLQLALQGSADASLTADYENVSADLSGLASLELSGTSTTSIFNMADSSRAELSGEASELEAILSGSSHLSSTLYPVQVAKLDMSDSSRAEINAEKQIKTRLLDYARLSYLGQATTTVEMKNNEARLIKLDPKKLSDEE